MKPKVYLTRKIPQEGIDLIKQQNYHLVINPLDKPVPRKTLLREVRNADGILCMLSDRIDREVIDASTRLKVISNYAVGYDNIDVSYVSGKRIIVTNTPGVLTEATAEITWALIFAIARRIAEADRFVREGKFKIWGPTLLLGRNINGKTLGIIGCGRIGQSVGLKATVFGMKVLYFNRSRKPEFEKQTSAKKVSLKILLKESDFITLHLPLIKETRHFIGLKDLRMMKPTAYLINAARGPIVDESALVYALKHRIIAGAGLDVYENEPKIHPELLKLDNVVLLPHLGSATVETRTKMATIASENLISALQGKRPRFVVNPTVLLIIFFLFIAHIIAGICPADVIVLKKKDPKTKEEIKIEGKILEDDKEKVKIETSPGKTKIILKKNIRETIPGKPPWEVYAEKQKTIKDTPAGHYELGKWCQAHGLKNEAKQEWQKAIELDPDHKDARKIAGYIKDDSGKWRLEKEVMTEKGMRLFEGKWVKKDKFEELMKQGKYAFTLKAAIVEDVDEEFLKAFGERMKQASAYLWEGTRGQFYIAEVTITDKVNAGHIIVPKGYTHTSNYDIAHTTIGGKGGVATIYIPGEVDPYTFLHEFGHAAFGLPDEKNPVCRVCMMRGVRKTGDWNTDPQFCVEENHLADGPACWTTILQQWPNLVGPDNETSKEIPPTKINIVNN